MENKFFTAGAFGGTLPAIYMADEGDGQKPVTDMRIFCGEVKSRDALAWKVATARSAMLSTSLGTEQPTCSARTEQPSCSLRSRPAKFTSEHSNGQPRHNPQHTLHLSHTKRCVAAYA